MRLFIIFWLFNFLPFLGYSQQQTLFNIQYIALKDSFLIKEVEKLIIEQTNSDDPQQFFKRGLGYITVNVNKYYQSDTLLEYQIAPSLHSIKPTDLEQVYSPFYSYIGGRIVLVFLSELDAITHLAYSKKSKKLLRKKVVSFLEKAQDATFYDMQGKKVFRDKNMRIDYFYFGGGKSTYILKNKPPIVISNKHY